MTAEGVRYKTASSGCETRTSRTTVVDIFNIIQKVQDTDIHLKVDEEQWKIDHTR